LETFTGTLESLKQHNIPDWYQDAKFGIFIHWGIFSIPAFAPHIGKVSDANKKDYDLAIANSPYTEWYPNSIKVPESFSAEFHQQTYGDMPYEDFRQPFENALANWKPTEWALHFKEAGARYVVLVTKHHDGFCLWPSSIENPKKKNWTTQRDVVGELADAVREQGMRFGVYYSGGIDWSFNPNPSRTLGDFLASQPRGVYPEYANQQVRELINRYQPDILWNDISWPGSRGELLNLFAYYYNAVQDGVVNDRWKHYDWAMKLLCSRPGKMVFDWFVKRQIRKNPDEIEGVIPPVVPHSDFRTPEYASFSDIQTKKWEATRGMSHSFAYNRNDSDEDYATTEDLLHGFIDAVSKNGNLLLNVGPRGTDAQIPEEQLNRLKGIGSWLKDNADAIYGTRVWTQSEAITTAGIQVRFTQKPDVVNLILLGTPSTSTIVVRDIRLQGSGKLLANDAEVTLKQGGTDLVLNFEGSFPVSAAHAIQIS
jgi:alpha-L-fucosidase